MYPPQRERSIEIRLPQLVPLYFPLRRRNPPISRSIDEHTWEKNTQWGRGEKKAQGWCVSIFSGPLTELTHPSWVSCTRPTDSAEKKIVHCVDLETNDLFWGQCWSKLLFISVQVVMNWGEKKNVSHGASLQMSSMWRWGRAAAVHVIMSRKGKACTLSLLHDKWLLQRAAKLLFRARAHVCTLSSSHTCDSCYYLFLQLLLFLLNFNGF